MFCHHLPPQDWVKELPLSNLWLLADFGIPAQCSLETHTQRNSLLCPICIASASFHEWLAPTIKKKEWSLCRNNHTKRRKKRGGKNSQYEDLALLCDLGKDNFTSVFAYLINGDNTLISQFPWIFLKIQCISLFVWSTVTIHIQIMSFVSGQAPGAALGIPGGGKNIFPSNPMRQVANSMMHSSFYYLKKKKIWTFNPASGKLLSQLRNVCIHVFGKTCT